MSHLDLAEKEHKIRELTSITLQDDFRNDPQHVRTLICRLNGTEDIMESYEKLNSALIGLEETHDLLEEDCDNETFELLEAEYLETEEDSDSLEIKIPLSREYDHSSAILELRLGAGGIESCDQADMLYRTYSRWAEKKGFKVSMLDYPPGDEAGIKSVTFLVEGDMAYGYLEAEKGARRLVCISPFDFGGRRHISFTSLDAMPQPNNRIEIEIEPEGLIMETRRTSGVGGQHISKTNSAVRMVYKPTGLVAICQSDRSQRKNWEEALRVLKSRLCQKMTGEQETRLAEIKGERKTNEWGSQVRSRIFHLYSIVKSHRTSCETSDTQGVADGDLDVFIFVYLKTQT